MANDPEARRTDSRTAVLPDSEALCRSILERHHDTIGVRKPAVAVPKLQRILAAALELSNRKGFQAMSLRDLSQASGLSAGGLYAYFDSKTTLLKMILGEVTDSVRRVLSHPPAEVAADPVAHLGWLIDTHLRLTEAMLPWFTFAFMEAKNFPPAERRIAIDSEALTESYFAEVIAAGIAAGRLRPDTSPLLPALVKPLLQEWYVKRAKYRRRGVTLDVYSATVQDLVLRACLPEGAPRPAPSLTAGG
ncbi:TetR/AcrR family transcriptional regulator [Rhodobaculum claviforme]|uniref:TetR family transcriptional regulator n=1 Tax=Rhodobaculum claviforme TaxID=1549854 RepID=A0A934TIH9_9RHOB|nr:TetR/AcrR family transcriptional regulator [Rhodobaculum claviforme]MBK5926258.1 TetR family transcriptional regulator [Rhodobaculum claviforme]